MSTVKNYLTMLDRNVFFLTGNTISFYVIPFLQVIYLYKVLTTIDLVDIYTSYQTMIKVLFCVKYYIVFVTITMIGQFLGI